MINATPLPFNLPAVCRKKLTVDFDGGNQSSDAGLFLLRAAERKIGVVKRLAAALPDRRDPTRIRHAQAEIIGGACLRSAADTRTQSITTSCATTPR